MPTNAIPAGSCNFPLNMPKAERLALGRLANEHGKSMAQLLRDLIEAGAKARPEIARRLSELRDEAMRVAFVFVLVPAICMATLFTPQARSARRGSHRAGSAAVRLAKASRAKGRRSDGEVEPLTA